MFRPLKKIRELARAQAEQVVAVVKAHKSEASKQVLDLADQLAAELKKEKKVAQAEAEGKKVAAFDWAVLFTLLAQILPLIAKFFEK